MNKCNNCQQLEQQLTAEKADHLLATEELNHNAKWCYELRNQLQTEKSLREKAEAACAEMRSVIEEIGAKHGDVIALGMWGKMNHATDENVCGQGYATPAEVKVLCNSLQLTRDAFLQLHGCYPLSYPPEQFWKRAAMEKADAALTLARQKGWIK